MLKKSNLSIRRPKLLMPENNVLDKNPGQWTNRILIGTPMTGLLRAEWVMARFGQVIPTNWSATDAIQYMHTYAPLQYLVADAQNLIVKTLIEKKFEWLLFIEHDNIIPPDAFIRVNAYMREKKVPIISGLYFTKSDPPEPLLYRGRGTSFFKDWKMGDKVWVDGIPMGFTLIHASILEALWADSPEYAVGNQIARRVFETPEKVWFDPESRGVYTLTGTSDLTFCDKIIKGGYFEKAGWPKYQKMKFPFLVDTNIFVRHVDESGRQFPLQDPKTLGF